MLFKMHEIIFKKHLAQQSLAFADTQLAFKGEGTKRIPSGCLMSTLTMLSHGGYTQSPAGPLLPPGRAPPCRGRELARQGQRNYGHLYRHPAPDRASGLQRFLESSGILQSGVLWASRLWASPT